MKIRHYKSEYKSSPLHKMTSDFGESCVDKTFFRPDVSSTRAFLGAPTGSTRVGLYDFPDGKDDGDSFRLAIRAIGNDITELDAVGEKIKARMSADIASQKAEKEIAKDKELMDALRSNVDKIANGEKLKDESVEESS